MYRFYIYRPQSADKEMGDATLLEEEEKKGKNTCANQRDWEIQGIEKSDERSLGNGSPLSIVLQKGPCTRGSQQRIVLILFSVSSQWPTARMVYNTRRQRYVYRTQP